MHRHHFRAHIPARIALTALTLTASSLVFALEYSGCSELPSEDARLDCYDGVFGAQDDQSTARSTRIEVERTDEFVLPGAGSGFPRIASRPAHGPLLQAAETLQQGSPNVIDVASEPPAEAESGWRLPNPFKR